MNADDIIYLVLVVASLVILNMILPGQIAGAKLWMMGIFVLVSSAMYMLSANSKHLIWFASFYVIASLMFFQSYYISSVQGTVLTENWWSALNWIKNNTPNCSVIATYWDPGHFITGIANRQVVFDGASQNTLLVLNKNGTRIVRSRIQDIATVLFTNNETEAVDILRNYRKDHCPVYFIASRDLIYKSQWWSYFSTWSPKTHTGQKYVYYPLQLSDKRPTLDGKGMEFDYYVGGSILRVFVSNQTIRAVIDNGRQQRQIGRVYYFSPNGVYVVGNSTDMSLFFFGQSAILVPQELENSLFTRMFFFDGYGLKNFKFVKQWGGEVKLFKVDFGDSDGNP